MSYIVLVRFKDLQDGKRVYNAGDTFPRAGLNVSEKRLEELSTTKNRRHIPLIRLLPEESLPEEAVPLTGEAPVMVPTDEQPSEKTEAKKKPKKTTGKTTGSKKNAGADS